MIDSPGIVAASSNPGDVMALRSLQVEEKEECPLEAVRTLLKQCNQQHVRNTTAHAIKTGDLWFNFKSDSSPIYSSSCCSKLGLQQIIILIID